MATSDLGFGYRREGDRIFCGDQELKKADAATFTVLNDFWARDAARVYFAGRTMPKADAASFRALDRAFARDDHLVWFLSSAFPEADATTFESLGPGTTHAFARDAHSVFHYTITSGKPSVLRGADPRTFRRIGESFGTDGEQVYHERQRLSGARAQSWRPLGGRFSTDGRRVFCGGGAVEGADATTFELLPGDVGGWARDAHRYYEGSRVVDRHRYVEHLRTLTILHGTARRAYLVDTNGQPMPPGTPIDMVRGHHFRIEVECHRWLRRSDPAAGAELPPGATLTVGQRYVWITPEEWRDRPWLWLLRFKERDEGPPFHGLRLILNWWHCMPETERPRVEALLAELDAA